MRRILLVLSTVAVGAALAGCGHNTEQRAATGAIAGAVVGGPIGAAVGAGVGTAISKVSESGR